MDLTQKLKAYFQDDYVRAPNRVSVSSVYAILQGWDNRPPDLMGMIRMLDGRIKHHFIQELMADYEKEVKVEYPFGDFILVGKADLVAEDHIIELKTSRELKDKAKEWEVMQSRLYCSLLQKPKCIIAQPCFTADKLYLKTLRTCKRDDEWFEKTLKLLEDKLKNA